MDFKMIGSMNEFIFGRQQNITSGLTWLL